MSNIFDIVIKGGEIFDGTSNPSFEADIGIKEGKIVKTGDIIKKGSTTIDAKGLVVSPGFIDMHNHADHTILAFPNAECYIMQGVTTSLVGNCGLSMAPINSDNFEFIKSYLSPFLRSDFDYMWDWRSSKEYFEKIRKNQIAINLAYLVGQGTLRIAVKGFEMTRASKEEMDTMKTILKQELEEGAFGLSTGLAYPPGSYSTTEELVELADVLKKYNALYATHIRSESDQLLESVEEVIKIGEENNIPVEISHHKAIGKENWGKVKDSLKMLKRARQRGVDINCDVYPYTAGMTTISYLLPRWSLEGGIEKMLERLKNQEERLKIEKDITEERMKGDNLIKGIGWENIMIAECPLDKDAEGKSLEVIFKERNQFHQPFKAFFDWFIKIKGEATMITFCMDEEDLKTVLSNPLSTIISDSWVISPNGGGKPHPRGYGSFPRILGKYVREEKLLTLEESIKKMTSLPANKIGLKDRGILKEGYCADITIFNKDEIKDKATFENPHQYPEGVYHVIVNGQLAVNNGEITGLKPGKILKRQSI
ncbi:D-aminoacylase [subsurface metagenome]|nr:amidohydrolase family protein [Clostridia bacterium]